MATAIDRRASGRAIFIGKSLLRGNICRVALAATIAFLFSISFAPPTYAKNNRYQHWAAIVVAGSDQMENGAKSEVFDNLKSTLSNKLYSMGFEKTNVATFSMHPKNNDIYSNIHEINFRLSVLASRATDGCFFYVTSHGTKNGILINNSVLSPVELSKIMNVCSGRPQVVVVSGCFSGVFAGNGYSNGIVMTASNSFSQSWDCVTSTTLNCFDKCFVDLMRTSFESVASEISRCVYESEVASGIYVHSYPQVRLANRLTALPQDNYVSLNVDFFGFVQTLSRGGLPRPATGPPDILYQRY